MADIIIAEFINETAVGRLSRIYGAHCCIVDKAFETLGSTA